MSITTLLPLVSAIFVFFLAFFIFLENRKAKINKVFLLFSSSIFIWLLGTFMMFISNSDVSALFWDKFVYVGVILIPSSVYHFGMIFIRNDLRKKKIIIVGYVTSFFFLIINIFTPFFVDGIFRYEWGTHAKAQFFHNIFLIFFTVYLAMMFIALFSFYKKNKSKNSVEKHRTRLMLWALLVLTMGSIGFLPAYEISVYPSAYISGLFFTIITAYVISKFSFLEVRSFASQVFIFFILAVSLVEIFLSDSIEEYILKSILFIAIALFSHMIIKNIKSEIKHKEELQVMTDKLENANEQLKKLDRAKSEFISIASHQLRTPLTSIKGYISLIMEGTYGKIDKKIKEALSKVYVSNERLIQLVENLLNISRIESGKIEYKYDDWQIENIINELADNFIFAAKKKKLYLHLDLPKHPLPMIRIDGAKVEEVISNVIDNAIKYTNEGGVTIKAEEAEDKIRVIVSDTGIGIPQDEVPYVFAKFSRGHDTSRLQASGTGLGMYVGKSLIEAQNGKIWVESKGDGKGSKFIIELPIKQEEAGEKRTFGR